METKVTFELRLTCRYVVIGKVRVYLHRGAWITLELRLISKRLVLKGVI